MSVRIHPEHGLNPTIPICIICNEPKNEVALLGASYKGEAPMHMLLDIEPCESCREKYLTDKGVLLVEAREEIVKRKKVHIPTGTCAVLADHAFKRNFPHLEIPPSRISWIEEGLLHMMGAFNHYEQKGE